MHMAATLVPGVLLTAAVLWSRRGRHCRDRWHQSIWHADQCPSCGQRALPLDEIVEDALPEPRDGHARPHSTEVEHPSDSVEASGSGDGWLDGCGDAIDDVDIDFD